MSSGGHRLVIRALRILDASLTPLLPFSLADCAQLTDKTDKKGWIPDLRFRSKAEKARERARKDQDTESIDDLLIQGRFARARQLLEQKVALNDEDHYSRIKLAELLAHRRQNVDAVHQYLRAAKVLSDDGFFDKGLALLKTARKLSPKDTNIELLEDQILRAKELDAAAWSVRKGAGEDGKSRLAASIELEAMWRRMSDSDFVQSLGPGELELLMEAMDLVPVGAGSYLVRQGADRRELYLVASGLLQARLDPDGRDFLLRNFGPGSIIGESVLFEQENWPATYRAAQNSQLLRLDISGAKKALEKSKSKRRLVDALSSQHNDQQVLALATSVAGSSA